MLTQTTETAIQCLIYLARKPADTLITPQKISAILGTSSSYTSKILRHLAKAGILLSHRGVTGGFSLNQNPKEITFFDVYSACQSPGPNNYCDSMSASKITHACGYHQAMYDVSQSFQASLKKWTIADIILCPSPPLKESPNCKSRWTHSL